jgi:hypothetical protein
MERHLVEFVRLIRAYLRGEVRWDEVHQFAVEMEWKGNAEFPEQLKEPLQALHFAFLTADERDDAQFRKDREEIANLVQDLDKVLNKTELK